MSLPRQLANFLLLAFLYLGDKTAAALFSSPSDGSTINTWKPPPARHTDPFVKRGNLFATIRGGGALDEDDEERYSRQVYTLGARAHGLIRSSTVYLDGPPEAGLVYECAKNLALSGVRHLVVVVTNNNNNNDDAKDFNVVECHYHDAALDDLGRTYQHGAHAEMLASDNQGRSNAADLLVEYLRRLNPNIEVSTVERSSLLAHQETTTTSKAVLLCMDRPYSTQIALNRLSRSRKWSFVAVETAGVFGRVFCDFGPSFQVHDVDGETPAVTPLDRIERFDDAMDDIIVHAVTGEKHDVSKGDSIEFQYRNGEHSEQRCVVKEVLTPHTFVVALQSASSDDACVDVDDFISNINHEAASFRRVKIPQELVFETLESVVEKAKLDGSFFTPCDLEKSFDVTRKSASLSCFQALSVFAEQERRLPTTSDLGSFWKLAQTTWFSPDCDDDGGNAHCRSFLRGCAAKFSPIQAVFGAIGAQEVLKAISGMYSPVQQILLYDCDEVLRHSPKFDKKVDSMEKVKHQALGLRHILGDTVVDKLQKKRIFVVGAGAIGCEILKNLASMGVGTRKKGKVVLTDMDTIEKSNLSRQLLFRDCDIGKFKSTAAQEGSVRLNPLMKVEAHSSKVGDTGNSPFDADFWSKRIDVVLNALDNVEARLYMDGQCVSNKKALIDAGTMGPKGNVQVVVPFQSESYASSVDPPEPSIPVCTLKNFPYAISHTIQWGRELFDGLFQRRPEQANDFIDTLSTTSIESLPSKLLHEKGNESAMEAALELAEDLAEEVASSDADIVRTNALSWSAALAMKLFYQASADLLAKHPLNSVDEDGEPFWSGTRRPPRMLSFSNSLDAADQLSINNNLVEFVRNCARLRVETILGRACSTEVSHFSVDDAERVCRSIPKKEGGVDIPESLPSQVNDLLSKITHGPRRLLEPIDFEKDDDSNGHVALVSAASNLRAIVYGIPPVDAMETRRVAGNIVPAMITTTAFVSALSCIELIKLVQNVDLKLHRNAFVNLALNFFAFTIPLPAEQTPGLDGQIYTLWDQLSVKESKKAAASGGLTLKSLIKKIKAKTSDDPSGVDVASISCGPFLLYANFLHEDDGEVLNASIWDIVTDALTSNEDFESENSRDGDSGTKEKFSVDDRFVELTVVVEDTGTGDEIELPPLRVERYQN